MPAVLNAMIGTAVPTKPSKVVVFYGHTSSPYTKSYEWLPDSGFGSLLNSGAALPGSSSGYQPVAANGIPGTIVGVASQSGTPYMGTFLVNSNGFGTKFSNPATALPSTAYSTAFTPNGGVVGYGHALTPFLTTYPVSSSGYGTKYANPATSPGSSIGGHCWTEKGDEVAYTTSVSPRWGIYSWSDSSGFGSRLANSYSDPAVAGRMGVWNSTGTSYITSSGSSGAFGVYILQRVAGAGFSNIAYPGNQIPSEAFSIAFSRSKKALVVGYGTTSPYIIAYQWDDITGVGTKYADPGTATTGRVWGLDFSPSGTDIIGTAVASGNSAIAWKWTDSSGFGTKYANPSTAPGNYPQGATVRGFYL